MQLTRWDRCGTMSRIRLTLNVERKLRRSILINHTCFKCKRRFELDPVFVGFELSKLKKKKPNYPLSVSEIIAIIIILPLIPGN